ncbi:MAG: hypothetical protein ABL867_06020 [Rickettsiales bacterium]
MNVTKTQKKQPASSLYVSPSLNEALLDLEEVCARMLEKRFAIRDDSERMYWQQRFKNIVTPVSLALSEIRGPRRFHHHYRHDADNDDVLLPVLENPLEILARACEHALYESNRKLSGIHDEDLILAQRRLEKALNNFLHNISKNK